MNLIVGIIQVLVLENIRGTTINAEEYEQTIRNWWTEEPFSNDICHTGIDSNLAPSDFCFKIEN